MIACPVTKKKVTLDKEASDPQFLEATFQIVPSCERMFVFCTWQGVQQECKNFGKFKVNSNKVKVTIY